MNTPFRYDFVGSFLRPLSLKEARKQFEAGTISKQELVKVEDACIEDLIAKQKTAGYHVITDGEFGSSTELVTPRQKQDCHFTVRQL